jgi:hypothetical protein
LSESTGVTFKDNMDNLFFSGLMCEHYLKWCNIHPPETFPEPGLRFWYIYMSMKLYDTFIESVNEKNPSLKGNFPCAFIGGYDDR